MASTPFVIQTHLTAIAAAYPQGDRIADDVLPRVPVEAEKFGYLTYGVGDQFQAPDDTVGRKSAPNQLDFASAQQTGTTADHGLDMPVPNKDMEQFQAAQRAGLLPTNQPDPQARGAALLTSAILNNREVRVANLVTNAANFATANKQTLSGTGQWSDFASSDPANAIIDKLDGLVVRPNYGAMSLDVWSKLRRNPQMIKFLYGTIGARGSALLADVAEVLGLKQIYIGSAFVNTAKPGQTAALSRCWPKSALFFYRAEQVTAMDGGQVTFGATAQFGSRIGGLIEDPDVGLRGGARVRVGENVGEFITAPDLGFLFSAAIA